MADANNDDTKPKDDAAKGKGPEDPGKKTGEERDKLADHWGKESMEASDPPANY